ncbi:hypothetical protein LEP1GSC040_3893 [Leptospira santarosai str. 2000030832]|nr:hypothetical protein LEP1GSC040_3893 [Leptospira santarosai str. 2000030832]
MNENFRTNSDLKIKNFLKDISIKFIFHYMIVSQRRFCTEVRLRTVPKYRMQKLFTRI